MEIQNRLKDYGSKLEKFLENCMGSEETELTHAMKYTLMAPGKRIRPVMMLAFYELCGGESREIYNFAAAIEMIHAYSLIHDDLPCMDNGVLRRGKKCSHLQFGQANALLAGDALLTDAFKVCSGADFPEPARALRCINILADFAGASGMVLGQYQDLNGFDDVLTLHRLKTASLFMACFKIGAVLAGADEEKVRLAQEIGQDFGVCFQLVDDLQDGDIKVNDVLAGKKAEELVLDLQKNAKEKLRLFGGDSSVLEYIMDRICRKAD